MESQIDQLETRLQDQFKVRCALEKALGYRSASSYILTETHDIPMPKVSYLHFLKNCICFRNELLAHKDTFLFCFLVQPATDLIKDIAVLEMEVIHLEQYLLSLYRKAFDQQISSVSPNSENKKPKSPPSVTVTTPRRRLDFSEDVDTTPKTDHPTNPLLDDNQNQSKETDQTDASFRRSHSQRSAFESRKASPEDSWSKGIRSCHSQPLYAQNGENLISLAEHLGTRISDHVPETPNKLSEGMVKCMSEIYCKLAEPPSVLHHRRLSSPNSSLSSSAFSPSDNYDTSSPGFGNNSFDVRLDSSFHVEGEEDFSGPYSSTMVEVLCLYRDAKKASEVEDLLQNFK